MTQGERREGSEQETPPAARNDQAVILPLTLKAVILTLQGSHSRLSCCHSERSELGPRPAPGSPVNLFAGVGACWLGRKNPRICLLTRHKRPVAPFISSLVPRGYVVPLRQGPKARH